MKRHSFILSPEGSALLLIDMQKNLLQAMDQQILKERLANIQKLIALANVFGLPILVTEQYPQGIGRTVDEIIEALSTYEPFEKVTFSAGIESATLDAIAATGATDLVIAGAEAHVCVLQTTLDLLERGYNCHLVEDAVISRRDENRLTAMALARQAGARIKVTEMVCFELLERAGTEAFKKMLPWIR